MTILNVVILYLLVATIAYLAFGDDTEDSVTLNLPDTGLSYSVQLM